MGGRAERSLAEKMPMKAGSYGIETVGKRHRESPAHLLPCPFCGGAARLITLWTCTKADGTSGISYFDSPDIPWRRVRCETCGTGSKSLPRLEAVAAWNKRCPRRS